MQFNLLRKPTCINDLIRPMGIPIQCNQNSMLKTIWKNLIIQFAMVVFSMIMNFSTNRQPYVTN